MKRHSLVALSVAVALSACSEPPSAPKPVKGAGQGTQAIPLAAKPLAAFELVTKEGRGFHTGNSESPAHIFILFEPGHVSPQLLAEAQSLEPLVRLTWVPVGQDKAGTKLAAQLLQDKDPAKLLDVLSQHKGLPALPVPSESSVYSAEQNQALMQRIDARMLPYVVGHNRQNNAILRDYALLSRPTMLRLGLSNTSH